MVLLDEEKAFDKIKHEWLFKKLDYFEAPSELADIVQKL